MTLHIINRSPFQHSALRECLEVISEDDAVIFIEDGVYAASSALFEGAHELARVMENERIYALREDILARGIKHQEKINIIEIDGFVALCAKHNPIQSWF